MTDNSREQVREAFRSWCAKVWPKNGIPEDLTYHCGSAFDAGAAWQRKQDKDCYCVCHSDTSSCPACEHCNGRYFQLFRQMFAVVEWLIANDFPMDWHSTTPAPAFLRPLLAERYAERDGESVESYLWCLDQEQVWKDND